MKQHLDRVCASLWCWSDRVRRSPYLPWTLAAALLALLAFGLLVPEDADARLGGGQGFSSGRRSSGGSGSSSGSRSSGGGGGGGDGGDLIFILVWLLFEQPQIGIPILLIVVGIVVVRGFLGGTSGRRVHRTHHYDDGGGLDALLEPARPSLGVVGLQPLRDADAGFSMPVFLDFVQLLHRRATEAAVTRSWDALAPFVSPQAREQLETSMRGVTDVREVVAGGIQVVRVERDGARFAIRLTVQNSRRETREGAQRHVYLEEGWTLVRLATATSKEPDEVARMGCPSCGSAIDTDRQGNCRVCGTPIVDGLLQWRAETVIVQERRHVEPPAIGFTSGGAEPGVHQPTVIDPDLGRQWRDFRGRHPGFQGEAFQRRVEGIFMDLQKAWSEAKFQTARPHVTDTLYQTLRFYLEQYTEHGLRNELRDVKLIRQEIVKVQMDAWYEAITVRIYGSMKDTVVNREGKVIGGNADQDRIFSEYWTFLRSIGSGDQSHDPRTCPSCGAPLDRVSQAGVCGYCESRITSGKFDWVLSRIDQAEVYRG